MKVESSWFFCGLRQARISPDLLWLSIEGSGGLVMCKKGLKRWSPGWPNETPKGKTDANLLSQCRTWGCQTCRWCCCSLSSFGWISGGAAINGTEIGWIELSYLKAKGLKLKQLRIDLNLPKLAGQFSEVIIWAPGAGRNPRDCQNADCRTDIAGAGLSSAEGAVDVDVVGYPLPGRRVKYVFRSGAKKLQVQLFFITQKIVKLGTKYDFRRVFACSRSRKKF